MQNRYGNHSFETTRYSTPAHFTINEVGNRVVHAPSDHGLEISTPAKVTLSSFPSPVFLESKSNTLTHDPKSENENQIGKNNIEEKKSLEATKQKKLRK